MEDRVAEIVSFIQQRYLWQFAPRTWDREENINGILDQASELLIGQEVSLDTPKENCFYADAKFFVNEIKSKFLWLNEMDNAQRKALINSTKAKMIEITITKSLNLEVDNPKY
ncbi:Fe-only/vanadium nitrogenase subunit delta [Clostridium algoriphilum]|uniref:Fe-only/vanadium nitrogenase subunit delta n=1 Tax=Clostridium algoriphilum TaxID=198347 RepID=UPI001CF4525C|nr:Fe-only/vanadium nitrogenase subunit delta [Clostridium algoriphilum]MCB2293342.1 Fe-only/vanadium nitrogenase subunit delta [Clostridium algoriphilum]